jgi:uncharacterized membrane protein
VPNLNRMSRRVGPTSARVSAAAKPSQDLVATAATIGAVAAGVALFEVALIPGLVIGGAAVLAPRYLPGLGKRLRPQINAHARPLAEPAARTPDRSQAEGLLALPAGLQIGRAVAKTITFRVIVTTLDFSSNYLVIGELGTAAGLSGFALVVGPIFYFVHETAWNALGHSIERKVGPSQAAVEIPIRLSFDRRALGNASGFRAITMSRALAKTITFRTLATAMDFTATFVVVGDVATAATLSAFGFVLGPFVYFGHEKAWDYYSSRRAREKTRPVRSRNDGGGRAPASAPLAPPR